jgi:hypothetical protein
MVLGAGLLGLSPRALADDSTPSGNVGPERPGGTPPADEAAPPAEDEEQPQEEEESAPEPIVSSNGLKLIDWYTTEGHQLHIVFSDQDTVRGDRNGTVRWTATLDNGKQLKGSKRFNCSPRDNYDTDKVLGSYQPKLSEQWARVTLIFEDNKGTSEFWFDVYLY